MNKFKYKYNIGEELWYIDIDDYEIRKGIISRKGEFFIEYSSPRQIAVYILKESKNPTKSMMDRFIRDYTRSHKYSRDKPDETEGYNFRRRTANIPVEFINKNLDELIDIRYIIYEIFYKVSIIEPTILCEIEYDIATERIYHLRYFK